MTAHDTHLDICNGCESDGYLTHSCRMVVPASPSDYEGERIGGYHAPADREDPDTNLAEEDAEGCNECGDAIEVREDDGTPWCYPCYHARGGEDNELQPIIDRMESYGDGMDPPDPDHFYEPDAFLEAAYEDRYQDGY